MKEKKNYIFLDIDGVIQPLSSKKRFEHLKDNIPMKLYKETNNIIYLEMNIYDLLSAYYDWNKESLKYIEKLANEGNAVIVLESDWRDKGYNVMKALFKLYNIDYLYYDQIDDKLSKVEGIKKYLDEHKGEYYNYVIIDDALRIKKDDELYKHLVTTSRYLGEVHYTQALHILKGKKVFKYIVTSLEEYNKLANSDGDEFYFILDENTLKEINEFDLIELERWMDKMNLMISNISKMYGVEAELKFSEAIKTKTKSDSEPEDYGVLKAKVLKI